MVEAVENYSEEVLDEQYDNSYDDADNYDSSETVKGSRFEAEYDEIFDGEERASNLLKITSAKFTRSKGIVPIGEIGFSEPTKLGRQKTMIGLTKSIAELGVVTPIHIMKVAEESASDDYKYVLIDGLRRVFGALKNNITEVDAVIWDFEDKELGMELLLPLSLILNRHQPRKWSEIWDLYRILEMRGQMTPGTLEYLLSLEAGDAMKLKDVMLCDYSDVKEALLNDEKDLNGCYKMLQKYRKDEDRLGKDDTTGFSDTVENADELTEKENTDNQLSDTDVLELLDMARDLDNLDDVSEDDFDALANPDDSFVDSQKVGERHPIDPGVRQAVLQRDNFTCQCCGLKMIGARLGLIAVHHIIPVHVNEKRSDRMDNLTTLCTNCHIGLHIMERNGGTILMSKEDFDALPENEQISLKKAHRLANIAIQADKRKGLSKQDIQNATSDTIRHPMPGVGLKENQYAYSVAKTHMLSDDDTPQDEEYSGEEFIEDEGYEEDDGYEEEYIEDDYIEDENAG